MIERINNALTQIDQIKFPDFVIDGQIKSIGYIAICNVNTEKQYMSLHSNITGYFDCFYHLINPEDEFMHLLQHNKTTIFMHKQFLLSGLTNDQLKFILTDGGYKCNIGLVEVYTAAQVGIYGQYRV